MTQLESSLAAVESLAPNPWNTNRMTPGGEAALEASIRRFGIFKPIVVRTLADGTLQIIGGQHRWEAAQRMGYEQVPIVNLGTISDKKAKEIGLVDNGRYGADDARDLSDLLKDLGTVAELSEFMPTDMALEAFLLEMPAVTITDLEIEDDASKPPPEPAPAPTTQRMQFNVPVEDVGWMQALIEDTMRDQNFTADDSKTNAGSAVVYLFAKLRKAA